MPNWLSFRIILNRNAQNDFKLAEYYGISKVFDASLAIESES